MTQAAPLQTSNAKPKQSEGSGLLVQRKCACGSTAAGLTERCEECGKKRMLGLQRKLAVNEPGDKYEQEADRIADTVMRMPVPAVQRRAPGEEESKELLRTRPLSDQITPVVQRQPIPKDDDDEEEALQTKESGTQAPVVTPGIEASVQALRQSGGQPLDAATRAFMEPRFRHDFGQVRIHTGPRAVSTAQSVNARAFTVGHDVFFASGEYAPGTEKTRQLLAHELAHVLQQSAGDDPHLARKVDPEADSDDVVRIIIRKREKKIIFVGERSEDSIDLHGAPDIFPEGEFVGAPTSTGFRFTPPGGRPVKVDLLQKGAAKSLRSRIRKSKSFVVEVADAPAKGSPHAGGRAGPTPGPGGTDSPSTVDSEVEAPGTVEDGGPGEVVTGNGAETRNGKPPLTEEDASEEQEADAAPAPDERDDEEAADSSTARKFGVLITTPSGDASGNLARAGTIENFKEMSRRDVKARGQRAATSTLVSCFGIDPSAAEVLVNTRKIRIRVPRLGTLNRLAAEKGSSSALPIAADMDALESELVDGLGVSEGNSCERKEQECFFGERVCLPRLNIAVSSIEEKRAAETAIGAAEAAADAVEILLTLGALEAVEEGGEFLFKQWLRQQRRKGALERKKLREIEKAGKQLLREKEQIRKGLAEDPTSVRPSSIEGYDAEIRVGNHTYRRRPDGTWCRSSKTECGIAFDSDLEKEIDDAFNRLEGGEIPGQGALLTDLLGHKTAPEARKEAGKSGREYQSAHGAVQSSMKSVPGWDVDAALTRILPTALHTSMDAHWKRVARRLKRRGRKTWTADEMFRAVSNSIRKTKEVTIVENGKTVKVRLTDDEKISHIERLRDEIFKEAGLKPTDPLRLPWS